MGVKVPRTLYFPIPACFRACGMVTRARPAAGAGAVPGDCPPSWLPDVGGVLDFPADRVREGILWVRPQGPRGRGVDERDVGGPPGLRQRRGLRRRRGPGGG